MYGSLTKKLSVALIIQLLGAPGLLFAQQEGGVGGRPRTVQPELVTAAPVSRGEQMPDMTEPTIRVALATSVPSAVISTTGRLLNGRGGSPTMVALEAARVRIEPRRLSPRSFDSGQDGYQLALAGAATREEAEETGQEVKRLTGEGVQITFDSETKSWGLLVGKGLSQPEAEEMRARLEDSGLDASLVSQSTKARALNAQPATNSKGVRFASRPSYPSRELIARAAKANLFSSSAPVTFASDNETTAPVRYNDRPYRGRIEVFANTRGTLTVVNELGLEDYVRGVVANELSPYSFPALEAFKAQAIAARTYALKNRGQFMSQGFDLLPTTRSQVYRGLSSENPLATRAVDETRGLILSYAGEPINALYTSTCGGRTEHSENIFNEALPYLRGHECAADSSRAFTQFTLKTTREPADVREEKHVSLLREVALLAVENFGLLRTRVSDSWLAADAPVGEVRSWLASIARLARQTAPSVTEEVNRPPAFATALTTAVFGENRADTLLNTADVEYFLATRDATDVPAAHRASLAMLLRDGHLSVYPDATLRPREPLSRGRILRTISRLLESRNMLPLQKALTRPATGQQLILRSGRGKDLILRVSPEVFLFRQIGEGLYPVRSVVLVGGEPVVYHLNSTGEVDFLEVRPAPDGAAADRFSQYANWTKQMSLGAIQARLGRRAAGIGSIVNLRVAARGSSQRVTDLEIVGTHGTAHLRGGKIRSALGLREQLFVIERVYDDVGRVQALIFTGRGLGHGVGLCQVGAYGLARQGQTFEEILKTYYAGIELSRLY